MEPNENYRTSGNVNLDKNHIDVVSGFDDLKSRLSGYVQPFDSSKAFKLIGFVAVLGVAYWATQKFLSSRQSSGGLKVGPDSREIDMTPKYGEGSRDVVEQASWESFPASDPPAY